MKTIIPTLFLEQVILRAEVQPCQNPFQAVIQIGRFQFLCEFEDFNYMQQQEFEQIYRARLIRFSYPGEFWIAPYFFKKPLLTTWRRQITTFPWSPDVLADRHRADGRKPDGRVSATGADDPLGKRAPHEAHL